MKSKLLLFCLLLFTLVSCSKDSDGDTNRGTKTLEIKMNVLGYTSATVNESVKKVAVKEGKQASSSSGFVLNYTKEEFSVPDRFDSKKGKLLASSDVTFSDFSSVPPSSQRTELENGVKYMVLVFNENDVYQSAHLLTKGQNEKVSVTAPEGATSVNYRFVAFSYNKKTVDDFGDTTQFEGNDPVVQLPNDKDFLYYNTKIPLNFSEEKGVSLVFLQQTARVGVVIDPRSTNAKVLKVAGSFVSNSDFKTGRLHLKNTSISNISPSTVSTSFSTDYTDSGGVDTASVFAYTVIDETDPTSKVIDNFEVSISELKLKNSEGIEKSVTTQGPISYGLGTVNNLSKGKQVNTRIYLFEGFAVENTLWSLANLYYTPLPVALANQPALKSNFEKMMMHRIRQSPADGRGKDFIETDYWRPDYYHPYRKNSAVDSMGDPCSKVYPGGWRLPNRSEIVKIVTEYWDGDRIAALIKQSKALPVGITRVYSDFSSATNLDIRGNYLQYGNNFGQVLKFYPAGYVTGATWNVPLAVNRAGDLIQYHHLPILEATSVFLGAPFESHDPLDVWNWTLAFENARKDILGVVMGYVDGTRPYTTESQRFNIRCVRTI